MAETAVKSVRDELRELVERLPDDATWEDVEHLVWMHQRLAEAREQSAAGLGITSDELRAKHGIKRWT